ncbi:hypothetical protein [Streptomyces sp. NPDC004286]|uniref:hypothetical protein n=1 Tax=Streptomyces sp. NPDC004286 TaxID=3364696 RepID=UPI0036C7FC5F
MLDPRTLTVRLYQTGVAVLELAVALTAAGAGGCLAYSIPGVPSSWRGVGIGWFALVFAFGFTQLLDPLITSLRNLTHAPYPSTSTPVLNPNTEAKSVPDEDLLNTVSEAAKSGATYHAAAHAWKIDPAAAMLGTPAQWEGAGPGHARFPLIEGAHLNYRLLESGDHPVHQYTFATSSAETPVTSLGQVHDLLAEYVNRDQADAPAST